MAASSNSSLSGSSVSSGKFLRRTPHFSPPSILAGSYLSAELLAVPLAPAPRQAFPQPRAGAPPGRRCPYPGSAVPQAPPKGEAGTEEVRRGQVRLPAALPCLCVG